MLFVMGGLLALASTPFELESLVRLGILGPLSVCVDDGRVITVQAARHRVLLAALLLRANQVASFDHLTETLWDAAPPAHARTTVRNYVMRLRRTLGPALAARIHTRDPGYLIELADDELDVLRFCALFRDGIDMARRQDWPQARAVLGEALGLWRGAALADISSQLLHRDEAPRLEEMRLQAVESRIDADLGLGGHAGIAAELRALVSQHPLRERFHAQLMLALYRSGRQADALAVYLDARERLIDELGVEPGAELRRLHERILRGEPDPADRPTHWGSVVPVPRQLPAAPACFTGRVRQMGELSGLLGNTVGTSGTLVVSAIVGMGGVGKTALAVHWAYSVAERFPDGQLYIDLRGFDPVGNPATPAEAIRRLLDGLGVAVDRIPADLPAQTALYRSLLATRRILVILDNARDEAQVRPLLPGGGHCMVLVTSRNRLAGLVASDGASAVMLDVLPPAEARELLARRLGEDRLTAEPDAVAELVRQCAGLPLALNIVAARLTTDRELSLADLAAEFRVVHLHALELGDPVTSLRTVLSCSYRPLSDAAARAFLLLALHSGPDISRPAAASLLGLPNVLAQEHLNELTRSHLLAQPSGGRFAFHDLVRRYAAGSADRILSGSDRRDAIHRLLDHYLHTGRSAALLLQPTRNRDPIEVPDPCPEVTPEQLADKQRALTWFETEHQVLIAAIAAAAGAGFAAHAWRIAWTTVTFLDRRGHWHDWVAVQQTALAAAKCLGDTAGEAYSHWSLGAAYTNLARFDEALPHLRQAIGLYHQVGDRSGEGFTLLALARAFGQQRRYEEALGRAQQASELFQATGHRPGQAHAASNIGWYQAKQDNYTSAIESCQQALSLHRELGDLTGEAATWDSLGYAHQGLNHDDQALNCYERALTLFRYNGDLRNQAHVLTNVAEAWAAAGEPRPAQRAWEEALVILDEVDPQQAARLRAKLDRLGADYQA
jgi:DNA-binding SARP family transcriptional activator/tetratricopeptide (TPR) repeat protein